MPDDVDLSRSPLRATFREATFTLGAFNPGFTRLPNGNLLMMVRVAEALCEPVADGHARALRWHEGRDDTLSFALSDVDMDDPRHFRLKGQRHKHMALTSISWLLPVELSPDGSAVVAAHYDRAVAP